MRHNCHKYAIWNRYSYVHMLVNIFTTELQIVEYGMCGHEKYFQALRLTKLHDEMQHKIHVLKFSVSWWGIKPSLAQNSFEPFRNI